MTSAPRRLVRIDRLLADMGLARSRTEARALIESGSVIVDGIVRDKPSSMASAESRVEIKDPDGERWVSRGAHKLIKALDVFEVDPSGRMCVDIGASTGGFTQVLLSRGAKCVAAVDVGYGQLAWELRNDDRVVSIERTNARYVTREEIGFSASLLTVDASFISLSLLLPNLETLVDNGGTIIALVKPQFEAGRGRAPKGVVRGADVHEDVLVSMARFVKERTGLSLLAADFSPIKGPEGNIEFIFCMRRARGEDAEIDLRAVVESAHAELTR